MEPVRYPQGRNMSAGCGCNTGNPRNTGYHSRPNQMPHPSDRTQRPNKPCQDRFDVDHGDFPVGMAYVPWQTWENLYAPEQGLCEGTIFMDLNQIFCGKRGNRA